MMYILLLIPSLLTAAAPGKNPAQMIDGELAMAAIRNKKAIAAAEEEIYDKALEAVLVPKPQSTQAVLDAVPSIPKVLCELIAEYGRPRLNALPPLKQVYEQAVPESTHEAMKQLFFESGLIVYQIQQRFRPRYIDFTDDRMLRDKNNVRAVACGFTASNNTMRYCPRCYEIVSSYKQPAFINPAAWHGNNCEHRYVLSYSTIPDDANQLRNHVAACLFVTYLKHTVFKGRTTAMGNEMPTLTELEQLEKECAIKS